MTRFLGDDTIEIKANFGNCRVGLGFQEQLKFGDFPKMIKMIQLEWSEKEGGGNENEKLTAEMGPINDLLKEIFFLKYSKCGKINRIFTKLFVQNRFEILSKLKYYFAY